MESDALCACGCGRHTVISPKTTTRDGYIKGHPRRYIHGHHSRGAKLSPAHQAALIAGIKARVNKPTTSVRTSRSRARKRLLTISACAWEPIGYCKGDIQCAHVDGNPMNNSSVNLLNLCRSHHLLLDKGRIDPKQPKMPTFYTDGTGKRRYAPAFRAGRSPAPSTARARSPT